VYEVDEKLVLKSITALRKNGKLFSTDLVIGANAFKRVFYAEDGKTPRAVLEVSEDREVFTVFDDKGAKRYEDVEETFENDNGGEYGPYGEYGQQRKTTQTFNVYNGAAAPRYTQTAGQNFQYGPYGGGQPETVIETVDEFEPGSTIVARRITPRSSVAIAGKYENLTKVEVLDAKGEVRFVRYLDDKNRIIRMVDKSRSPEVVTDIAAKDAAVEEIDPALLKSPETPADLKLAEQMVAGNTDMHLQRLLVP
jgi:hypothetical protein